MSAIAGVFVWIVGNSLLSACLITTVISWYGGLCFYRVARDHLDAADHSAALYGCLFVPSVVFWGAAYAKEAVVMGAFGVLALSTYRLLRERSAVALLGVVVGGLGVGLIKPYVLFPYILAVAAWIYADRAWKAGEVVKIRPAYLVFALLFAAGGIAVMGSLFPQFGVNKVAETVANQQALWQQTDGGSNMDLGSEDARTLASQLPFLPIALINALFRPALFEARNAPMLGAALETTAIAVGVVSVIWRYSWRATQRVIFRSPLLVYSVVFVLTFSVAVGLATSNLGSLSRYRVPMMPFYVTALLVLARRLREERRMSVTRQGAA